jgi:RNA polymerase sigma-70 factor (ECF subfamily)
MPPSADFARLTDPHRRELVVHCYRMLGSYHDAEDAVQETYLRAWRHFDRFEERSTVRTWLYRIATRVCLSALDGSTRRMLPSGLGQATDDPTAELARRRTDIPWLEPLPDLTDDPATIAGRRESTRLAFVAALQELPARQRAALLLCDVLSWPSAETAQLLELSVAAVNSALQRARLHLARTTRSEDVVAMTADSTDVDQELLDRFVAAFESADIDSLAGLLRADVALEMPPIPTWFDGLEAVTAFYRHRVLPTNRRHVIPLRANGCPAAATYVGQADGSMRAHNIQVLEIRDGAVEHIYAFLDPDVFEIFGLPIERAS